MSPVNVLFLLPNLPFISADFQTFEWWAFLFLSVCSYAIQVWAHRFSIRATGIREASYEQAFWVVLTEFISLWGVSAVARNFFLPWYVLLAAIVIIRIVAFRVAFRAEWGKAIVGAFVSTAIWVVSYVVLAFIVLWLTGYLRFSL